MTHTVALETMRHLGLLLGRMGTLPIAGIVMLYIALVTRALRRG